MTKEQFEEKSALSEMISREAFNYKSAIIRMIYNYKYGNGTEKIEDISYSETDSLIEIRIGKCYIKEMSSKIEDVNYKRAHDAFVNFLISNTVKL